ncbi:MAG: hypothetical protein LBV31_01680, partial [Prevotellaceae bacterium]|nr:hypothetical protein [Prevotellaceae bacterium]
FLLVSLGLVVFKADSIPQAIDYIAGMGSFSATAIAYQGWNHAELSFVVWLSIGLMIYEYLMEKFEPQLKAWFNRIPNIFRWVVYLLLILCIIYLGSYGAANENTFIYFQF